VRDESKFAAFQCPWAVAGDNTRLPSFGTAFDAPSGVALGLTVSLQAE